MRAEDDDDLRVSFDALPHDVLQQVALLLPVFDVLRLSAVCRACRVAFRDDGFWALMCVRERVPPIVVRQFGGPRAALIAHAQCTQFEVPCDDERGSARGVTFSNASCHAVVSHSGMFSVLHSREVYSTDTAAVRVFAFMLYRGTSSGVAAEEAARRRMSARTRYSVGPAAAAVASLTASVSSASRSASPSTLSVPSGAGAAPAALPSGGARVSLSLGLGAMTTPTATATATAAAPAASLVSSSSLLSRLGSQRASFTPSASGGAADAAVVACETPSSSSPVLVARSRSSVQAEHDESGSEDDMSALQTLGYARRSGSWGRRSRAASGTRASADGHEAEAVAATSGDGAWRPASDEASAPVVPVQRRPNFELGLTGAMDTPEWPPALSVYGDAQLMESGSLAMANDFESRRFYQKWGTTAMLASGDFLVIIARAELLGAADREDGGGEGAMRHDARTGVPRRVAAEKRFNPPSRLVDCVFVGVDRLGDTHGRVKFALGGTLQTPDFAYRVQVSLPGEGTSCVSAVPPHWAVADAERLLNRFRWFGHRGLASYESDGRTRSLPRLCAHNDDICDVADAHACDDARSL